MPRTSSDNRRCLCVTCKNIECHTACMVCSLDCQLMVTQCVAHYDANKEVRNG